MTKPQDYLGPFRPLEELLSAGDEPSESTVRGAIEEVRASVNSAMSHADIEAIQLALYNWAGVLQRISGDWPDVRLRLENTGDEPDGESPARAVSLFDVGLDPDDLRVSGMPQALLDAAEQLRRLTRQLGTATARRICQDSRCWLFDAPYTQIAGGLQPIRDAVRDIIRADIFDLGEIQEDEQGEHFESSLNEHGVKYLRALYSFPLFLRPSHNSTFGLIPWARQELIGIVLSDRSQVYTALKTARLDKWKPKKGQPPEDWPTAASRRWLLNLMQYAQSRQRSRIGGFAGYIFQEVLSLLAATGPPEPRNALWRAFAIPLSKGSPSDHARERFCEFLATSHMNMFVFDPAEALEIEGWLRTDDRLGQHVCIVLPHGLSIPTGIGFTLGTLPSLIEGYAWRHLREAVDSAIAANGDLAAKLLSVGLVVLTKAEQLTVRTTPVEAHAEV